MKTLLFDPFAGISGDMTLAAFAGLGVPEKVMSEAVAALKLPGCSLSFDSVVKNGIHCHRAVIDEGEDKPLRHLPEIEAIINKANLPDEVKQRSLSVFRRIAAAEAEVHGTTVDKIHFHEIGAVDTLVDVVGNVSAFLHLKPEAVYTTPVRWGKGTVKISHGHYPLPAPATALLLKGIPGFHGEYEKEWTTPTGAALLAEFLTHSGQPQGFRTERISYGAGSREHEQLPNALRLMWGESGEEAERVMKIETQVDDMPGEELGYLHDLLKDSPALDWFFTPVQMKKNRPGILITLLCREESRHALENLLLRHTSTIGLRYYPVSRRELERRFETVETEWGPVQMKISGGSNEKAAPEHDDCARIAQEQNLPLSDVRRKALETWINKNQTN